MVEDIDITEELQVVMAEALQHLQKLIANDNSKTHDLLSIVKVFLLGVVSTAVDLVEITMPGSAPFIYADVEAAAKQGGLRAIKQAQLEKGSMTYSVSNIGPDDISTAMNYLGQELSTALFKGLHELPMPLRKPETFLRGIEAMLANLLNQKFDNSHQILDNLCDHVHMALDDLQSQRH